MPGFNLDDESLQKYLLRYLNRTRDEGLCYRQQSKGWLRHKLIASADAGYNPPAPEIARAGGTILMNGSPVDWVTVKTAKDLDSPSATEITGLYVVARKLLGLRYMARELGISQPGPTPLFCDSQTNLAQIETGVKKARHLLARYSLVSNAVDAADVVLMPIPGAENPADITSKVVFKSGVHQELKRRLGMCALSEMLNSQNVESALKKEV